MPHPDRISDATPPTPALSFGSSQSATPNLSVRHSVASDSPVRNSPGLSRLTLQFTPFATDANIAPNLDVDGRLETDGTPVRNLLLETTPWGRNTEPFSRGGTPEPPNFDAAVLAQLRTVIAPDGAAIERQRIRGLVDRLDPEFESRVTARVEAEKAVLYERLESELDRLMNETPAGWLDQVNGLKETFAAEEQAIRDRAVKAEARDVLAEHGHNPDLAELL
ncbi:hypothetical protein E4K72_04590 [Oxalobacteraceae bacterium OM1]|nr:hypothetical protein E4K72_04590 [Oxalobacteraceae bacterium OM1]